jgi:D-3-phosphoglycerate dehydrogenase
VDLQRNPRAADRLSLAHGAHAVITPALREGDRIFPALPNLRVVGRMGIGLDSIDIPAATRHGVCVVNVPNFCEEEVSDQAMALLLACAHKIAFCDRAVRAREWNAGAGPAMHRLRGRTLGLMGFGKIPRLMAPKAQGFGLRVIAHDPFAAAERARGAGVALVDFDTLLRESDYLSIHCPLTEQTRGLFNAGAFARMKREAVLINTARGAIVHEADLIAALRDGRIAGAGLDVLAEEPPAPGNPLPGMEQVVLTPHAAYASCEAVVELQENIGRYVIEALHGRKPESLVNPEIWDSRRR